MHQITKRRLLRSGLAAVSLPLILGFSGAAVAQQDWPNKPVRIVLAIGPGSSGDILARMIAPKLQQRWGQPVIVENKPGASGVVGTDFVVRATDGHTLLLGTQSSILPKYTQKNLRFDPLTDLVAVRKVLSYQLVIATNAETFKQAKTLKDLIALSKRDSKGILFSGLGPTAAFNLTYAILNQQLGAQYSAVNHSNVNDANLSLIRNDAQFIVNNPASIRPYFGNGSVVPLAALSTHRYADLPEVPTLHEAVGYNGYIPQLWAGFFVPKGTPEAVVQRVNADVQAVFEEEAFRKEVETKLNATISNSSPTAFAKDIRDETAIWVDVFKKLNIQPE
jgi:tripartite-type tricarboxylate transporter receptor subunit TctC